MRRKTTFFSFSFDIKLTQGHTHTSLTLCNLEKIKLK